MSPKRSCKQNNVIFYEYPEKSFKLTCYFSFAIICVFSSCKVLPLNILLLFYLYI